MSGGVCPTRQSCPKLTVAQRMILRDQRISSKLRFSAPTYKVLGYFLSSRCDFHRTKGHDTENYYTFRATGQVGSRRRIYHEMTTQTMCNMKDRQLVILTPLLRGLLVTEVLDQVGSAMLGQYSLCQHKSYHQHLMSPSWQRA